MFERLLIANRGEIAVRIARTARAMGLHTIGVYSDADRAAMHVRHMDEAVPIGPAEASRSYLNVDAIVDAARRMGADAVHPGYGFLSESARLATALQSAGIVFVGPPPAAIEAMGLKDRAKALMDEAGVPVVPGYAGSNQTPELLKRKAYEIGYPVLIKAVAGGGGKGMRRVDGPRSFDDALQAAVREAQAAFGDGRVLVERYVEAPRHIEVQVFADTHGNVVHLGERDCSLQRRHQKVVEEAPAPGVDDALRARIGEMACAAARAVDYVGAGTVEFIADGSGGLNAQAFFFMEMNTRLQVEHPVTEAVCGVDLVEWQLRVAAGEALPLRQEEITHDGHAIEARLYAEDPVSGFLPASGPVRLFVQPEGPGIRVDAGVETGDVVTPHYDPMIAKIVAHGPDRPAALRRLAEALRRTVLIGPATNLAFLRRLLCDADFSDAQFDTGLIDRRGEALRGAPPDARSVAAAAIGAFLGARRTSDAGWNPFDADDAFQIGPAREQCVPVAVGDERVDLDVRWSQAVPCIADAAPPAALEAVDWIAGTLFVQVDGTSHALTTPAHAGGEENEGDGGSVPSPIHGRLVGLSVEEGDVVAKGDILFTVEAMKMEHGVTAPVAATVIGIDAGAGDQVDAGQTILRLGMA